MHEYEILCLVAPDLTNERIEAIRQRITGLIEGDKGHLLLSTNWGKRKLAYRVKKQFSGIYLYFRFLAKGTLINELERVLKIQEDVFKYLTVKLDEKVDVEKRKTEVIEPDPFCTYDEVRVEPVISAPFSAIQPGTGV